MGVGFRGERTTMMQSRITIAIRWTTTARFSLNVLWYPLAEMVWNPPARVDAALEEMEYPSGERSHCQPGIHGEAGNFPVG
jgi:hypothetical protein